MSFDCKTASPEERASFYSWALKPPVQVRTGRPPKQTAEEYITQYGLPPKAKPGPRGRMAHAQVTTKLTPFVVRRIRRAYEGGISQTSLARTYGVSQQRVSEIVNRQAWDYVQ